MSQPKALFLADVIKADPASKTHHDEAAAELRRLHDEVQMLDAAYRIACKIINEQDRKLAKVEAVNAELLAALKVMLYTTERHVLLPGATPAPESPVALARAALAKAEGQK